MHVISRKPFLDASRKYPNDSKAILDTYKTLRKGSFKSPNELKAVFPSLDNFKHKDKWWVIDLGGNNLRLLAFIEFRDNRMYVKHIVSHTEYNRLCKKVPNSEDKIMAFALLKKRAMTLFESAPWITSISTENEYNMALELMEELIEDYEANKPLIDVLSLSIKTWEDESETFAVFNKKLLETHQGISALRVLMDQYELKTSDLPEIGSKSLVSKILNGHRNLTTEHIAALAKRFKVSPELFF